jgi:hypothetical protein
MGDFSALDRLLQTDPRDVGCEQAIAILHVYIELLAGGRDAEQRYPGEAAHLAAYGPCDEDFHGLSVTSPTRSPERHPSRRNRRPPNTGEPVAARDVVRLGGHT